MIFQVVDGPNPFWVKFFKRIKCSCRYTLEEATLTVLEDAIVEKVDSPNAIFLGSRIFYCFENGMNFDCTCMLT